MTVRRDGTIWLTEHGPKGGDEINIVTEGGNYGWPRVTYGTSYDALYWRGGGDMHDHGQYVEPAYAFVPSIGINQAIEVGPPSHIDAQSISETGHVGQFVTGGGTALPRHASSTGPTRRSTLPLRARDMPPRPRPGLDQPVPRTRTLLDVSASTVDESAGLLQCGRSALTTQLKQAVVCVVLDGEKAPQITPHGRTVRSDLA